MQKTNSIKEIEGYIESDIAKNLEEDAFIQTLNFAEEFLEDGEKLFEKSLQLKRKDNSIDHSEESNIARVINAVMGVGKSTSLKTLTIKTIEQEELPLLCVFNNNDNMNSFSNYLQKIKHNKPRSFIRISSENNDEHLLQNLHDYQVVAITKQRLRDLKLGYGNPDQYLSYKTRFDLVPYKKRSIIIDEMPIFTNSEEFDLGKNHNCLDWYDEMAKQSTDISEYDLLSVRAIIPSLVLREVVELHREENGDKVSIPTQNLLRNVREEDKELIKKVISSLEDIFVSYEFRRRFNWFKRLLVEDGVGVVYKTKGKGSIICSEWIDYTSLGNVLVFDGTADINTVLYKRGGYEIKYVKNPHDYSNRLYLNHRIVNSSKKKRSDDTYLNKVKEDIENIRKDSNDTAESLLALPMKGDVEKFVKNGVITPEQEKDFFSARAFDSDSMALNLLNTTGKNELSKYKKIALLNLPIKPPVYYIKLALAVHGVNIDLSIGNQTASKRNTYGSTDWFSGVEVQTLYKQDLLAEISQVIHRTNIREVKSTKRIDVYIYTKRSGWINEVRKVFKLPQTNNSSKAIQLSSKFTDTCEERLEMVKETFDVKETVTYIMARDFGAKVKNWLNENWKSHAHREHIELEAEDKGIEIIQTKNGKMFRLVN
ncbi:hypothetical protein [Halobacillus sp. H74]|uniref:hypothetical protein n=1 Tax=Halobacillus sp. H74 TaxID=3457436 RepID=UPI003FCE05C9